jgi:hypothetical protein
MPDNHFEINSDNPDVKTGVPSNSLDLVEESQSWPETTPGPTPPPLRTLSAPQGQHDEVVTERR